MTQTKADRSAAAKKAAATRERNQVRAESQTQGIKAAATRQSNAAKDGFSDARRTVGSAAGGLVSAGKSAGNAAVDLGKSAVNRARALGGGKR